MWDLFIPSTVPPVLNSYIEAIGKLHGGDFICDSLYHDLKGRWTENLTLGLGHRYQGKYDGGRIQRLTLDSIVPAYIPGAPHLYKYEKIISPNFL